MNLLCRITITGALVVMGAIASVRAAVDTWTKTTGGVWEDTTGWSLGRVPTNSDTVNVTAGGSYTVTVVSSAANTVPTSFTNTFMNVNATGNPTVDFNYTNAINFRLH